MIITTWIVYILARKGAGFPFPPKVSSDVEVVESEAVSVVQHWLKKTEEEASQDIKEKMSTNCPPTHGQDVHVTRDEVMEPLSRPSWGGGKGRERGRWVLPQRVLGKWAELVQAGLHPGRGVLAGQREGTREPQRLMVFCSRTRIFQVPSEVRNDAMRERIEQVRRSICHLTDEASQELHKTNSYSDC
ncbi:hypothetical protein DBR06_SOUSAS21810006 [Sousa chinensis]|uniref:Spermatogenesis-associated protein 19, mitochondrial n=1 Tax=Sousa chinensis TaxID=103600 RepID=A0A484GI16_SOUCH|nr:hypothetical protein DBR06_SOUSAS21810006 [Sousa chinensis]